MYAGESATISSNTSLTDSYSIGSPIRLEISQMIFQSSRAWPGGSSTLRPTWTRRSVFVYVPSFSSAEVAGSTTSANSAVSVRKMSCTTRNSSAASALRTLLMFGSERNGFSPIMYIPRTPPLSAEPTISVTVRPGFASSSRPHAASNFSCAAALSTRW